MRFLREAAERLAPLGQADVKSFEAFRQVLARIERVTYEDMDREMGVFGDPITASIGCRPCGANTAWTSSSATSTKAGSWITRSSVSR